MAGSTARLRRQRQPEWRRPLLLSPLSSIRRLLSFFSSPLSLLYSALAGILLLRLSHCTAASPCVPNFHLLSIISASLYMLPSLCTPLLSLRQPLVRLQRVKGYRVHSSGALMPSSSLSAALTHADVFCLLQWPCCHVWLYFVKQIIFILWSLNTKAQTENINAHLIWVYLVKRRFYPLHFLYFVPKINLPFRDDHDINFTLELFP